MKSRQSEYIFVILGILVSIPVFGGQCFIKILNEKNSGEKITLQFSSKLKSQKQCQTLAKMHRPNFNPNLVKFKIVNYQWVPSQTSQVARKKIKSHLAVAKRKKSGVRRSSHRF
ncbi:MAG: hypothetical protein ACKOA8_10020 [Deltaproteobacteria bacterium]